MKQTVLWGVVDSDATVAFSGLTSQSRVTGVLSQTGPCRSEHFMHLAGSRGLADSVCQLQVMVLPQAGLLPKAELALAPASEGFAVVVPSLAWEGVL